MPTTMDAIIEKGGGTEKDTGRTALRNPVALTFHGTEGMAGLTQGENVVADQVDLGGVGGVCLGTVHLAEQYFWVWPEDFNIV